jgi:UDP-N-acetylglucosamine--N-acetylmuramyl-(pentapeptide) pyrophosphoryl-undecaprenol N-acetylglucosamine transferase
MKREVRQMKVILSCGGTAGHVYPALALAQRLQSVGHEILFVGTPDSIELTPKGYVRTDAPSMERDLAEKQGIPFEALDILPLDSDYTIWRGEYRAYYPSLLLAPLSWRRARGRATHIIESFKPDVVVGFGGYVCAPIVWAADRMGIPTVLHEQNSVMGKANARLARNASVVALTYECTRKAAEAVTKGTVVVTGNPVRPSMTALSRQDARSRLSLAEGDFFILVFGGSRGARNLNRAVVSLAPELLRRPRIRVLHATGQRDYEAICKKYQEKVEQDFAVRGESMLEEGSECAKHLTESLNDVSPIDTGRYQVVPYIDDMDKVMPAADLVISRAGSTTIAEITALGVPSILVPFAHATGDHQTKNAQPLVEAGAALMFADASLGLSAFIESIMRLVDDDDYRQAFEGAAQDMATNDALSQLAHIVMSCVSNSENNELTHG